jgi:hypothetical protein
MSAGDEPIEPCCKDLATALSFETGRHFFVEDGALKLLVAHTPQLDGSDTELENAIRYCPFCGKPAAELLVRKSPEAGSD